MGTVDLGPIFSVGNAIIDWASTVNWPRVVAVLRVVSVIVSAALVWGIVAVLKRHRALNLRSNAQAGPESAPSGASAPSRSLEPTPPSPDAGGALDAWREIQTLWEHPSPSDKRLALIKADALLERRLEELRLPGENIGERLKRLSSDTLPNIEEVWFAHKLRNFLVHDPNYPFDAGDAERAFRALASALRALLTAPRGD